MDDSDIIVLDSSAEEQPSTSRSVFSIASPDVCQRWTQPSPTPSQPKRQRVIQPHRLNSFLPFGNRPQQLHRANAFYPSENPPQPIITSVTSLSPQKNQSIAPRKVSSAPREKHSTIKRNDFSYKKQSLQNSSSFTNGQPIITRVESLSPIKNQQNSIENRKTPVYGQKNEPECIVLDDDDNVDSNSIPSSSSKDLKNLELEDLKVEQKNTAQSDQNIGAAEENMKGKSSSVEICKREETEQEQPQPSNKDHSNGSAHPTNKRKRIKPTRVVVENETPKPLQTLEAFKTACLCAADNKNDMETILEKKLDKNLKNCSSSFKKSSSFENVLQTLLKKVETDPANVYVHLTELISELKARKASKEEMGPPKKKVRTDVSTVDYEALENAHANKKIKTLSQTLNKLQKIIKKLEAKEVSWEDDEDSSYIQLQRYKERAVKVFHKLCEYTNESKSAGKINKIHLSTGTRFPEVNRCVEKFVNSTGEFPDYTDILDLLKKANEEENMKLPDYEIEEMARKVFEEVGGELQRQRRHGLAESTLVFAEGEDPAESSSELKAKLAENSKHWEKINDLINDYAKKAHEKKEAGNEEKEEEGEDEVNEEEDEDKDEEDDDEEEDDSESVKEEEDDLETVIKPECLSDNGLSDEHEESDKPDSSDSS